MGARAVVWVATAAVLGVQLAPWHVPAWWLAAAGTGVAGIACCRRTRVPVLAAVAILSAAAGSAGLRAADGVGGVTLPLHTTIRGEVVEIRRGWTSRSR